MGWDINYANQSKKDCVNDLLHSMQRSNWQVLGQASTAQGAYFAVKTDTGEFMYCALIERRGKEYAIKTMDEGMGPCMNDCPLKLLALVDGPKTEWALKWREGVKAFHANTKAGKELVRSIVPGMTIMLYSKHYTVIENNGTHLIVVGDGRGFKISRAQFKSVSIEGS